MVPALEHCIASVGWEPEEWRRVIDRLEDTEDLRLREMDRLGIELAVLSLGSDGIQGIGDRERAVEVARQANDELAAIVDRRPDRYAAFAALAMQDPDAATAELERAVAELGFRGALVNGYSDLGDDGAAYYDAPEYVPFWERAAALGVPIYLHPRNPPAAQREMYRPELLGPTWAFAVETGTHALRLITSGLFDRVPGLTVILGHLGEQLPFAIARLEQRLSHNKSVTLAASRGRSCARTSSSPPAATATRPRWWGSCSSWASDRVLFSADYPFEEMSDAAEWFDALPISADDRLKIGRTNAARLLRLELS